MQNRKVSSTPINQARESLGEIKKYTVSEMVKRFNQTKNADSTNRPDHVSPIEENSVVGQVSFFNDISQIRGTPSTMSIDSGYDSFRGISQSYGSGSVRNIVLDSYGKYPNFKFSQLKYFGVDPKQYLSMYNIDFDGINGHNEEVVSESMRERSQTFTAKHFGQKRTLQDVTEYDARQLQKRFRVSMSESDELTLENSKGDSATGTVSQEQSTDADGPKSSVQAIDNKCNVRRKNTKLAHERDITDLKMRILQSLHTYEVKCQHRMMNEKSSK